MDDNFETKPIQLITDEERIKDAKNQIRLSEEFTSSDYNPTAVAIFERIDPRFPQPIIAIMTYGLNIEGTISAIQVSNPYRIDTETEFVNNSFDFIESLKLPPQLGLAIGLIISANKTKDRLELIKVIEILNNFDHEKIWS